MNLSNVRRFHSQHRSRPETKEVLSSKNSIRLNALVNGRHARKTVVGYIQPYPEYNNVVENVLKEIAFSKKRQIDDV